MKVLISRFAVLCIAALLPGCASIVSSSESTTYIETDPEKARCELDGKDFKRVVETPNSMHLPAKAAPIKIRCTAEGYHDATADLDTSSDGWILGNVLLGGVIGLAVDAATQSGMKFPKRISLALDPKGFETAAARDAWHERRRKFVERQWVDKFLATSQAVDCNTSSDESKRKCFQEMADSEIRTGHDEAMAELKKKYDASEIGVAFAAKPGPEDSKPAGPKSFTSADDRDAWYAEAKRDVEQKYERLMVSQRKERYRLGCDKGPKQAASQECKDADFQIGLLRESKAKELTALKSEYEAAQVPVEKTTEIATQAATGTCEPASQIDFARDRKAIEKTLEAALDSSEEYYMKFQSFKDITERRTQCAQIEVTTTYIMQDDSATGAGFGGQRNRKAILVKRNNRFYVEQIRK